MARQTPRQRVLKFITQNPHCEAKDIPRGRVNMKQLEDEGFIIYEQRGAPSIHNGWVVTNKGIEAMR